jgi:hypothetical protein
MSYNRNARFSKPGSQSKESKFQGPDGKHYLFPDGTTKEAAISYFKKKGIGVLGVAGPWEKYQSKAHQAADDPSVAIAYTQESTVNKGGIKTIHWTSAEYGVASIEPEDGSTLDPTPAPTLWRYLLALLPVFGFVVPWGSVRALAWVGVGFFEKSE